MTARVLGWDPGLAGGLAIIDRREVLLLIDLPVHRIGVAGKAALRPELDLHAIHGALADYAPYAHAFVERAAARPGQGTVSMFRFGVAFGSILGLLAAMGVPFTVVQPKAWQKHHGIGPTPDAARQRAMQLYPAMAPRLGAKRDVHRADALLIGDYGWHQLLNGSRDAVA
jgi:hypothetical protein